MALSAGSAVGLAPGIAIADLLMLVVCGVALSMVARLPVVKHDPGLDRGLP